MRVCAFVSLSSLLAVSPAAVLLLYNGLQFVCKCDEVTQSFDMLCYR